MTEPIALARMRLRSHHFVIDNINSRAVTKACNDLSWTLVQYRLVPVRGQLFSEPDRVYATRNAKQTEYRFHINSLNDFKLHLDYQGIGIDKLEVITEPMYTPDIVEYKLLTDKTPYDYQQDAIDKYLLPDKPVSKLVDFQTGKGKGLTLQLCVMENKSRLLMIMKSGFLEKWKREMDSVFRLKSKDITIVKGADQLKSLIDDAVDGKPLSKIIMIGLTTMMIWINAHKENPEELKKAGFRCAPDELCKILRVGVRAFDEVHMCFHQCFSIDLHTHAPKTISMSATLFNKDPFISKMYKLMFPLNQRRPTLPLTQYIDVVATFYDFKRPDLIRTRAFGSTFHSSGAMEQSILGNKTTCLRWLELIKHTLEIGYMKVQRPKKRVVIYVYLKDTVNKIVHYLREQYPGYKVSSYIDKDPLDNILSSDITVSTLGSAGTNLDIPDLTNTILARDITSLQSNIQLLGRLRELKTDKHAVTLHYLVANNIEKSYEYHLDKMKDFQGRVKSHQIHYTGMMV